jgi:hypothetical protein
LSAPHGAGSAALPFGPGPEPGPEPIDCFLANFRGLDDDDSSGGEWGARWRLGSCVSRSSRPRAVAMAASFSSSATVT